MTTRSLCFIGALILLPAAVLVAVATASVPSVVVVLFAAGALAVVGVLTGDRSRLSAWERRQRGLCPKCGYQVRGQERCPECGTPCDFDPRHPS